MVRAGQDSRNPFASVIRASQPALNEEARLLGPICLGPYAFCVIMTMYALAWKGRSLLVMARSSLRTEALPDLQV